MPDRSNIDFLIITKDEEKNLPHALASTQGWAGQVFVVDSGSTDATEQITAEYGAQFIRHEWPGYAHQKNWALDNLPFESDWIFILDADEVVLPELREELAAIASGDVNAVRESGFMVNRYTLFMGRRIRHCGYYPAWNLRFFKKGKARYEERRVHEHMLVDGPTGRLKGHIEHWDRRGIEHMVAKHNWYSMLEAQETFAPAPPAKGDIEPSPFGTPIARRRWIKSRIAPFLPVRWLWRFAYMYLLRLGVLDGLAGYHLCLFMACYQLMIDLKIRELRRPDAERGAQAPAPSAPAQLHP